MTTVSVGPESGRGLAGSSAQGGSQTAFSRGSVTKEESTCKLKLLALAKFISLTDFLEFISLPWLLAVG